MAASLLVVASLHAQTAVPNVAGTYSGTEVATLVITEGGGTDTETFRGSNTVVITQNGSSFSFTTSDPSSGVSVTRTLTLSGNAIVSGSGPAVGFRPTPGLSVSQNQITSATGTVSQGRIDLSIRGRATGTFSGVAFSVDVTSNVVLTGNVAPTNTPPAIAAQPQSRTLNTGTTTTFTVSVNGSPPFTYQWRKNGADIGGATGASYTIASVQAGDAGGYSVVVSNAFGAATSPPATLTVLAASTAPVISVQPRDVVSRAGATVALTIGANGATPLNHQWRKNGVSIAGATGATLVLNTVSATDAASYSVLVTNSLGSAASASAAVTLAGSASAVVPSRLANLSVRSAAGTGAQTLIVGFAIGGAGTSGSKPMLVRGSGPALAGFGVTGVLADPRLALYNGSTVLATNDDWAGDPQVAAIGAQVGAFALSPAGSKDAAFYRPAQTAGTFSVQVMGANATSGIALAELYDATPTAGFTMATPRLINVSARTQVGTGADILIAGFVIDGPTAQTVLVRGVGPSLSGFGVTGVLSDPKLELFQGATKVGENDDWGGASAIAAVFGRVGAFALSSVSAKDSVLLITLPPGAYTAQISGIGGTTGVALVEIYEVP